MWSKFVIVLFCFFSSAKNICAQDQAFSVLKQKASAENKKDTLLQIKGSLSVSSVFYYMNGGNSYRRPPFSWTYSGNPVISFKGVTIPTSIIVGEQHRYFRQPFNQVGISPQYKWITLHLGYRNLNFSPFTLGGHTMLGGGVELNPGKWKIAFMYGRLRKAIGEDPLLPYSVQAGYKRTGYGATVAYGTKKNRVAISILRARDDTSSAENYLPLPASLTPGDNLVAGIQSNQEFSLKKTRSSINWNADVAVSAYNRDYRAMQVERRKLGIWKSFTGFFKPTTSMQLASAAQTSLAFKKKNFSSKVLYRRISPEYMSMGAYFFQTDVESITVEPSWKIWKRKLNIQSSFGVQKDNLSNKRLATTKRSIGSLNVSFEPDNKYGVEIQLSNYGIAQQAGTNPLNDTIKMVQANKNISVISRYLQVDAQKAKSIILMLNYQQVSDLNSFTSATNESRVFFTNLTYSYTWIPEALSMSSTIQYTVFSSYAGKNSIAGITGSISKNSRESKWNNSHSASVFFTKFQPGSLFPADVQRSVVFNIFSGVQYSVSSHHKFNGNVSCIVNLTSNGQSFTELNSTMGYTYNF